MNVQVILLAAGSGVRLKAGEPKAFVLLKDKPLFVHSLAVFQKIKMVKGIVVVGHKDHLERFKILCRGFNKVCAVVAGGAARADSVKCALAVINKNLDIVLVHDAARPLIDAGMVNRLLTALKHYQAAIVAVPVKATIKKVNAKALTVEETPRRDQMWEAQTPQGFHKDILIKAHRRKLAGEATDDAMLAERMGVKIKIVMGDYRNIKITTPEDLKIAKGLM